MPAGGGRRYTLLSHVAERDRRTERVLEWSHEGRLARLVTSLAPGWHNGSLIPSWEITRLPLAATGSEEDKCSSCLRLLVCCLPSRHLLKR
jgi:hypothetical protein